MDQRSLKKTLVYLAKSAILIALEVTSFLVSLLFPPKRCALPPITDKILLIPAVKLSEKIKKGELSCEQVLESYIKQIKRVNPIINAVVDTRFEKAVDEARELDRCLQEARKGLDHKELLELPLVGVPFTVKETISLEGSSYTAGLPERRSKKASSSNEAVNQLKNDGKLIPMASTNTHCMNMWWDSQNLVYGRTVNPYDLSRIVGGSSGGEAAILAAAGSLVGVGSDLAGSIRIPCNFCGVFGHKPTPFVVHNKKTFPALRDEQEKLRGLGPMTRYACDLTPMLKIMLKKEELNRLRLDDPVDLRKIKLFYCEDLGDPLVSRCNNDILAGLRAAVQHLCSNYRVPVERVTFDEFKYGMFLFSAELNVAGGPLVYPEHEDARRIINPLLEFGKKFTNSSDYPFNTIFTALVEQFGSKAGTRKHKYLTSKAAQLRQKFNEMLGENGVLLMPTHPQPAPHHHTTIFKFLNVAYTAVGNTLHAPITQCPLGLSKEGLPFGLQIISKPYNDRLNLALAQELEKAFGGWMPPSRVSA